MPLQTQRIYLIAIALLLSTLVSAQCLTSYSWNFAPQLVDGNWGNEETVTICLDISETDWQGANHYLHALIPDFGSGWDLSTLVVIPPPSSCSGDGGHWDWYAGPITSEASGLVHSAGFYYESDQGDVALNPNNPGDNFGDNCPIGQSLQFCFQLSTLPYSDCESSDDLSISINTLSDDESGGSFLSATCTDDADAVFTAGLNCCDAFAGADSSFSLCSSAATVSLNSYLETSSSGQWFFENTSTPSLGPTLDFDPSSDVPGQYLFVVDGVLEDCEDIAFINVSIDQGYDPGESTEATICQLGSIVFLHELLGPTADAGGSWTDSDGSLWSEPFNPSSDVSGTYTYSYPQLGSCASVSAEVEVTSIFTADAGDDTIASLCTCDAPVSMFSLLDGVPQAGGVWMNGAGNVVDDIFDPSVQFGGTYTYLVDHVNCSDAADLEIHLEFVGDVGTGGAYLLCEETIELDLFSLLLDEFDTGGTWYSPDNNPLATSIINPSSSVNGSYTYRFDCLPCGEESTIDLSFIPTPSADIIGDIVQCTTDSFELELSFSYDGQYDIIVENSNGNEFNFENVTDGMLLSFASQTSSHYFISNSSLAGLIGCEPSPGPGAEISISGPPTALITGQTQICAGQSVDIYPDLIGNGPFVLDVFNSVTGVNFLSDTMIAGDPIRVYPNTSTIFTIQGITDSSDSTCTSVGIGSHEVMIEAAPSATLTGGGIVCGGDSAQAEVTIDGIWTDYDLTLQASFGELILEGVQNGETIFFPVPNSLTYCLAAVNPAGTEGCEATLTDTCMAFEVLPNLITYSVSVDCDQATQVGNVHFFIQGGSGNYFVNGDPIMGNEFTSSNIPNGSIFSYSITDDLGCGPVIRSGVLECECLDSRSGEFIEALDTLNACIGESIILNYDSSNEILDSDDVVSFLIHDGGPDILGTPLITLMDISGGVNYSPTLNPDQIYWITAIVARDLGNGMADPDDVCIEYSQGVGIRFHALPSSILEGASAICAGEQASVPIQFTGNAPWNFDVLLDGVPFDALSSDSSSFLFQTNLEGTYTLTGLHDAHCQGISEGALLVSLQQLPTASISEGGLFCEGSGTGPLVELEGEGPWTLEYSIDSTPQTIILGNSPDVIPVSENGTYSLIQIADSYCSQSVSGDVDVTVIPAPTTELSVGPAVCNGDSVLLIMNLEAGITHNFAYSFNGFYSDTIASSLNQESFYFAESGEFSLIHLNDGICNAYEEVGAEIIVNELPELSLILSADTVCEGSSLEVHIDTLSGVGPFGIDFYYDGIAQEILVTGEGWTSVFNPSSDMTFQIGTATDLVTGCTNNLDETLTLVATPYPIIDLPLSLDACDGDTLLIGVEDEGDVSYSWEPEEIALTPDSSMSYFTLENQSEENESFDIQLMAERFGCISSHVILMNLSPTPYSDFNYNPIPITAINPIVNLYNEGDASLDYVWTIDRDTISQSYNTSYLLPEDISSEYEICLEATEPIIGCSSNHCEILEVLGEMSIYIPNSFSPNGDGMNDDFGPVVKNADLNFFSFDIYNRSGLKVFSSKSPNIWWNGLEDNTGKRARTGAYTYVIETRDKFGRDSKRVEGFVILLR